MDVELDPPHRVARLHLGMTIDEARSALGLFGTVSERSGLSAHRASGLGLSVGFGPGQLVNAIEVWRPHTSDLVRYRDVDVFGLPALEVVERLRRHTGVVRNQEDAACFIAPDLLLSFWRPFAVDDDPTEEQGYFFSSVLLARPGYYDTPAEAAARLEAGGTPGY